LCAALAQAGYAVRAATREAIAFPPGIEIFSAPDFGGAFDAQAMMANVDAVVHLAGIAHAGPGIAEARYDRVNRAATADLAQAAARAGAKHFIFFSSIRAQTGPSADAVVTEASAPKPTDPYGRSKLAAEDAVRSGGVPFTIFRPVLVYGEGVKGNLASLLRLAASPWPLPFGAFGNKRSWLARDNLIAAVTFALETPSAHNEMYVLADPAALTLAEIVTALREAMGRPPRLLFVPPKLFEVALSLMGRADVWQRLGGNLVADPKKLIAAGWRPPVDTHSGLAAMARAAN
jgi:UDP-glucose 4-epimerase